KKVNLQILFGDDAVERRRGKLKIAFIFLYLNVNLIRFKMRINRIGKIRPHIADKKVFQLNDVGRMNGNLQLNIIFCSKNELLPAALMVNNRTRAVPADNIRLA